MSHISTEAEKTLLGTNLVGIDLHDGVYLRLG
jgi:hypothetical protein